MKTYEIHNLTTNRWLATQMASNVSAAIDAFLAHEERWTGSLVLVKAGDELAVVPTITNWSGLTPSDFGTFLIEEPPPVPKFTATRVKS